MNRQSFGNLFHLANRAADEHISGKKTKPSEKRIDTHEKQGLPTCMETGCGSPVVGNGAYIHCEAHLDTLEKRWYRKVVKEEVLSEAQELGRTHTWRDRARFLPAWVLKKLREHESR